MREREGGGKKERGVVRDLMQDEGGERGKGGSPFVLTDLLLFFFFPVTANWAFPIGNNEKKRRRGGEGRRKSRSIPKE